MLLFSPLCRATAKYKHGSCMHVGEAANGDKKNNKKEYLFWQNNSNQQEFSSWYICSIFLLQLKITWSQTVVPQSQDCLFPKRPLSCHNSICNPDFRRRNLKVYGTVKFSCTFVVAHLWEYWTWVWHGEGILCFCRKGTQGCVFCFPKKKNVTLWFDLINPNVIDARSLTFCISGSLLSQATQSLWWRGFPVPHVWQITLPF